MDWHSRRDCKTQQEAIEALASLPRLEHEAILGDGNMDSIFSLKGQAQEFAAFWQIPFDASSIHSAALAYVKELKASEGGADDYEESEEVDEYGGWMGSTSICW